MGLNAPLVPTNLTKELGLPGAVGVDSLYYTDTLRKPYMTWYFTMFHLSVVTFSPWLPKKAIAKHMRNKDDKSPLDTLGRSLKRAVVRGSVGSAWESTRDVCYDWDFDPRLIKCRNICVWHATDDTWCPPQIGKWIAEYFGAKEGVHVNFKDDDLGYGHLTYYTQNFL